MNKTHRAASVLLIMILPWFLPACDGWPAEGDEIVAAESRLIADIELGNGNRYKIWVEQAGGGDELGFVATETGPAGNPSVVAVEELDVDNLSELFHAIAPARVEMPAELLAAFGEPSGGERGWMAERWRARAAWSPAAACDDTWWVNQICNKAPGQNDKPWLNWGVTTNQTSWHWNTYKQTYYRVHVCNQGSEHVELKVRYKDKKSEPTSQWNELVSPGTNYYWWRGKRSAIYNVHSYVYANSGTSMVDLCVSRTPS